LLYPNLCLEDGRDELLVLLDESIELWNLFGPLLFSSLGHQDLQNLFQPFLDLATFEIFAQSLFNKKIDKFKIKFHENIFLYLYLLNNIKFFKKWQNYKLKCWNEFVWYTNLIRFTRFLNNVIANQELIWLLISLLSASYVSKNKGSCLMLKL